MTEQEYLLKKNSKLNLRKSLKILQGDSNLILDCLDSIIANQNMILDRLSGSNIGKIQEGMTILELKGSFPYDQFSGEESDKHGTDIIGTIRESGIELGKITVSVKHQNRWSSEFVMQLEKNIDTDGTRWGFLVTTTFPADALNDNIWTARTNMGRLILLVKPQFVSIAYYAMRTIVIYEYQLKEVIRLNLDNNFLDFSQKTNFSISKKGDNNHVEGERK